MWTYVAIAIGGALGCVARYAQTNFVQAIFGREFPFAMMSINLIGSVVLGMIHANPGLSHSVPEAYVTH